MSTEGVTPLPLVVDLDGTLIRGDLLHETATRFIIANPFGTLRLLPWTLAGPARLKTELASRVQLDVASLPYDPAVLAWVREEADSGREVTLVSASHESLVDAVAEHVGIFTETIGTTAQTNLRSERKAEALVDRYGSKGFEYIGNHRHDLDVWKEAATAHVVTRSKRLARAAGSGSTLGHHFAPASPSWRSLFRSLRPHQWLKNVLVLVPVATAQLLLDVHAVIAALTAFAVFCMVASSVYVLNDLADLDNDRHHPQKRNRPFAAGQVSLLHGWMLWPVLLLLGLAVSVAFLPWMFTAVLTSYFAITVAYTFVLKRLRIVDVVTLAALYTVRVIAGIAAIGVTPSMWLLTFSLFLFLSLALIKRVSELTRAREQGGQAKGRGYIHQDLELLSSYGVSSSVAAAVIFALYLDDPLTTRMYATPELLWGALPILLTWLMRAWLKAHRGEMDEDPILFAARDGWSLVAAAALALVFLAAKVVAL
jgi:4-hydroxybenzoate polyprenyltransferase/phosphoserine phosphatase